MPRIEYKGFNFRVRTLAVIEMANEIIAQYQAEGYELTLRQLYYQFVSRDIIPNTQREYSKLGIALNNGRLAGLIDWNAIIDRTRKIQGDWHWDSPAEIIESSAESYKIDTRATQSMYLEVWVEKDALIGVVERACTEHDVPFFSCRGYVSQSAMWRAGRRISRDGRPCTLLHLGDHDPSGIDMTRDIQDRLDLFGADVNVRRIALTLDQVEEYGPPPNPAKLTDSRCNDYINKYGGESWELDALDPRVITDLIGTEIEQGTNSAKRQVLIKKETAEKRRLRWLADNWENLS